MNRSAPSSSGHPTGESGPALEFVRFFHSKAIPKMTARSQIALPYGFSARGGKKLKTKARGIYFGSDVNFNT